MEYVWVGVGGFLGANARYALGAYLVPRLDSAFPRHTLLVNVSGSLAIGIIMAWLTERFMPDPVWRLMIVVGFLGGYTTFPSYTYEAVFLADKGEWLTALWYALASNGVSLAATYGGLATTRALVR